MFSRTESPNNITRVTANSKKIGSVETKVQTKNWLLTAKMKSQYEIEKLQKIIKLMNFQTFLH